MTDRLQHLHSMVEALSALRQSQRTALLDTIRCINSLFQDRNVYSNKLTMESLTAIVGNLQDIVLATNMVNSGMSRDRHHNQLVYDSGSEFEDDTELIDKRSPYNNRKALYMK